MKTFNLAKWSCTLGITSFILPILLSILALGISRISGIMLPITGVYVSAVFLSGLASVLAIIFGIIARKKIKAQPSALQDKGLALAGIISGTIWISLNIIGILIIVIYFLPNFLTR